MLIETFLSVVNKSYHNLVFNYGNFYSTNFGKKTNYKIKKILYYLYGLD